MSEQKIVAIISIATWAILFIHIFLVWRENKKLRLQVKDWRKRATFHADEMRRAEKMISEKSKRIGALGDQLDEMERKAGAADEILKSVAKRYDDQIFELETRNENLKRALEKEHSQGNQLAMQVNKKTRELEEALAEIENLKKKNEALEGAYSMLENTYAECRRALTVWSHGKPAPHGSDKVDAAGS